MMKRVLRLAGLMALSSGGLLSGGLLSGGLLLGAGCFETPKPACAFLCGSDGACPDGYQCQPDKVCHLVRSGGRIAECDMPLPVDASVDAAVDAGPP
jgi:hypothetical protein